MPRQRIASTSTTLLTRLVAASLALACFAFPAASWTHVWLESDDAPVASTHRVSLRSERHPPHNESTCAVCQLIAAASQRELFVPAELPIASLDVCTFERRAIQSTDRLADPAMNDSLRSRAPPMA